MDEKTFNKTIGYAIAIIVGYCQRAVKTSQ